MSCIYCMVPAMGHCDIHATLERAGLSKTSQRVAVLTALVHAETPLSARDILARVSGGGRINRVTVYRILASFKAGGIIRELATDHGENFFEMACRHNPAHPHFYCRSCRSLACLPSAGNQERWIREYREADEAIETVAIHFTGLCRRCRSENAGHPVRRLRGPRGDRRVSP